MSYRTLVFTVLRGSDEKFEIYGQGKNAEPERIIHYKMQQINHVQNEDGIQFFEWVIVNPNMKIPRGFEKQSAVNLLWELS